MGEVAERPYPSDDVLAGERLPPLGGDGKHRRPSADRQSEAGEIHLFDLRVHQETIEERIHAREGSASRSLEDIDEAVHVARIWDEAILGADGQVSYEVHH